MAGKRSNNRGNAGTAIKQPQSPGPQFKKYYEDAQILFDPTELVGRGSALRSGGEREGKEEEGTARFHRVRDVPSKPSVRRMRNPFSGPVPEAFPVGLALEWR